jgi:hypothetical protein
VRRNQKQTTLLYDFEGYTVATLLYSVEMRSILSVITLGVSWASLAVASRPNVPRAPAVAAAVNDSQYATGWFDQLLDHDKPELGTFKQRYFWSTEYWKGPGSPVEDS